MSERVINYKFNHDTERFEFSGPTNEVKYVFERYGCGWDKVARVWWAPQSKGDEKTFEIMLRANLEYHGNRPQNKHSHGPLSLTATVIFGTVSHGKRTYWAVYGAIGVMCALIDGSKTFYLRPDEMHISHTFDVPKSLTEIRAERKKYW